MKQLMLLSIVILITACNNQSNYSSNKDSVTVDRGTIVKEDSIIGPDSNIINLNNYIKR